MKKLMTHYKLFCDIMVKSSHYFQSYLIVQKRNDAHDKEVDRKS